jgi:hypothetical protein
VTTDPGFGVDTTISGGNAFEFFVSSGASFDGSAPGLTITGATAACGW